MATCIALLRGINVGKAKRIAMADLRSLVEGLGHENARTLLNSGNVVFEAQRPNTAKIAKDLEAAIVKKCGFSAAVMVVTAADLDAIIDANPAKKVEDESKFLVAFVQDATVLDKVRPLAKQTWAPETLTVGAKAAYLFCANGINVSKLVPAVTKASGEAITARNWATVLKLKAMVAP